MIIGYVSKGILLKSLIIDICEFLGIICSRFQAPLDFVTKLISSPLSKIASYGRVASLLVIRGRCIVLAWDISLLDYMLIRIDSSSGRVTGIKSLQFVLLYY
jgi:hypothetical protein